MPSDSDDDVPLSGRVAQASAPIGIEKLPQTVRALGSTPRLLTGCSHAFSHEELEQKSFHHLVEPKSVQTSESISCQFIAVKDVQVDF